MNKQHLYTFGGALLASTALSGAANAITIGKFGPAFTTTAVNISNTIFSTTASTANGVEILSNQARAFGARFANVYNSNTALNTGFSIELIPTGAEFTNGTALLTNVDLLLSLGTAAGTTVGSIAANIACSAAIGFGTTFVINGCTAAAGTSGTNADISVNIVGVVFSGVTFTNASGLATVGNTVSLSGRVYNTATSGVFEAASSGTILTAAAPVTINIASPGNVTASATATPVAFSSLTATNAGQTTNTMDLVNIMLTGNGVFGASLAAVLTPQNVLSSLSVTVASAAFSGGATNVQVTSPGAGATVLNTLTTFTGGTITFHLHDVDYPAGATVSVRVTFNGTSVIPEVAAGAVTVVAAAENTNPESQTIVATVSGSTATISQGGFRAEINTFNSSGNGPFGSYLRIHNNGAVAGGVNIVVRNDDHASGATLGSTFTTGAIQPGATMQLSAAEMEGTATSTKLPAGGANIPAASRVGSYTLRISGPIVGYVQHILFDGNSVADLSSFRNSGQSASAP